MTTKHTEAAEAYAAAIAKRYLLCHGSRSSRTDACKEGGGSHHRICPAFYRTAIAAAILEAMRAQRAVILREVVLYLDKCRDEMSDIHGYDVGKIITEATVKLPEESQR